MAAGHVNRTELEANYQSPGDVYDDVKTEGAFEVVAQQVDDNYDDAKAVKDALASTTAGASGAHYVKSAAISGVTGGTVHAQISDVKSQLDGAAMGAIPDGTLKDVKLSNASGDIKARFVAHEADTSPHGATISATANLLALRDTNGAITATAAKVSFSPTDFDQPGSEYPTGISYSDVSTAQGWPVIGSVLTVIINPNRCFQMINENGAAVGPRTYIREYHPNNGWSAAVQIKPLNSAFTSAISVTLSGASTMLTMERTGTLAKKMSFGVDSSGISFLDSTLTSQFQFNMDGGGITRLSGKGVSISAGDGSPEGSITAFPGSIRMRTDNNASTTLYVKESGTGNTGWKAVQTA